MKRIKFQHHAIHTNGKIVAGLPFMGEMMTCVFCHKAEKSNPEIESGWTRISADDKVVYICPECFDREMNS